MTTIVVDSKMGYMAADRQATSNDCDVAGFCPKIRRAMIGGQLHLLASSGNEGPATIAEDWWQYGDEDEPMETMESLDGDDLFTTVILTPKSEILLIDKFMRPYKWHGRWYATGTGGPFAWAILEAGNGIHKAMETAIRMDPHSGFGYEVAYLESAGVEDEIVPAEHTDSAPARVRRSK